MSCACAGFIKVNVVFLPTKVRYFYFLSITHLFTKITKWRWWLCSLALVILQSQNQHHVENSCDCFWPLGFCLLLKSWDFVQDSWGNHRPRPFERKHSSIDERYGCQHLQIFFKRIWRLQICSWTSDQHFWSNRIK